MPNENDLAVGDKVQSNYGGRTMTVVEIFPPYFRYRYRCTWVGSDGAAKSEVFCREQLKEAEVRS